jgi:hypothetical protein
MGMCESVWPNGAVTWAGGWGTAGVYGALAFGGGFALGGVGVMLHSLPLLYLGCGFLGIPHPPSSGKLPGHSLDTQPGLWGISAAGTGIGLSYVPPVATLVRWFPDRRGMATGLTLMGFGGGALVMSPLMVRRAARFALVWFDSPCSLSLLSFSFVFPLASEPDPTRAGGATLQRNCSSS